MTACIIDQANHVAFHCDRDDQWVKREFVAFDAESAGRYALFALTEHETNALIAAMDGKLLENSSAYSCTVPEERRLNLRQINRLRNAYLIRNDKYGGFRLTANGEHCAAQLQEAHA